MAADAFPTPADGLDRSWLGTGTAAGCHSVRREEERESENEGKGEFKVSAATLKTPA